VASTRSTGTTSSQSSPSITKTRGFATTNSPTQIGVVKITTYLIDAAKPRRSELIESLALVKAGNMVRLSTDTTPSTSNSGIR
jgi:hypothetical protein